MKRLCRFCTGISETPGPETGGFTRPIYCPEYYFRSSILSVLASLPVLTR